MPRRIAVALITLLTSDFRQFVKARLNDGRQTLLNDSSSEGERPPDDLMAAFGQTSRRDCPDVSEAENTDLHEGGEARNCRLQSARFMAAS